MRRQGQDVMQVNLAGIRRDIVNLAHNYSNAQKAVRKATSNDPWGPSSTLMSEIADFTYNVVAFTEIMQMLWKRLNDHGKNWRHVYKALLLLEYLVKTGSEKVAQQCKENIFAIETLKDFRYMEGCKDQGVNVREKAKNLVALLKDDERLRNERARALKAKERAAQSLSGYGSDGLDTMSPVSSDYQEWEPCTLTESNSRPELEAARPQTVGEEELQLQLALAMSREEAEQEEQRRRSDDVRLQLALSQSQQDFKAPLQQEKQSHMLDLLDVNLGEASNAAAAVVPQTDPWGIPLNAPPAPRIQPQNDPWSIQPAASNGNGNGNISPPMDPWTPVPPQRTRAAVSSPDPFDLEDLSNDLPCNSNTGTSTATGTVKKTPQSFLGENSSLVNLDNLVSASAIKSAASPTPAVTVPFSANPFATTVTTPPAARPTINQIRQDPWAISTTNTTANPFLS